MKVDYSISFYQKALFLALPILFSFSSLFAQTNTTTDGDWNTGGNWTGGVPASNETANIFNNMTVTGDLLISNGGDYTVSGGSIVSSGGLELTGSGSLTVSGNTSFAGTLSLKNNASLTISSGDTLIVDGDFTMDNSSTIFVEAGGAFVVGGNVVLRNTSNGIVDGNMAVGGSYESNNTTTLVGSGNLEVDGPINTNGGSSIFGSTGDCDPGPCEEGSGAGLPVKLIQMLATYDANKTLIVEWVTLSETNNEYFTLMGSSNGLDFEVLKTVNGAGTSARRLVYQTTVGNVYSDLYYLKLMQTDFDGKFEIFNPIVVRNNTLSRIENNKLSVYPNPSNGENFNIEVQNLYLGYYTVSLRNSQGKLIAEKELIIDKQQIKSTLSFDKQSELKPGLYFIGVTGEGIQENKSLIIH